MPFTFEQDYWAPPRLCVGPAFVASSDDAVCEAAAFAASSDARLLWVAGAANNGTAGSVCFLAVGSRRLWGFAFAGCGLRFALWATIRPA